MGKHQAKILTPIRRGFRKRGKIMKYAVLTTLLLLISVGCHTPLTFEAPVEQSTDLQTVEGLMTAFDDRYNSLNSKWETTSETIYTGKRHLKFTLAYMDAKYPRDAWLQMGINKGITIDNFKAYHAYLDIRADLILEEFHARDDWDTVREAHIDTHIKNIIKDQGDHKLISEAKRAESSVKDWMIIGENALPEVPGRIYVQQTESQIRLWHTTISTKTQKNGAVILTKSLELTKDQEMELVSSGVEPEGWEVVYLDEKGNPILSDK